MELNLPSKVIPIHSILVSMEDIKKIYERLLKLVDVKAEEKISSFQKREDEDDKDFEAFKEQTRKDAFRITVTISGKDGSSIYGDNISIFSSSNLPDEITNVYMTNVTAYQGVAKQRPLDAFELQFDFSKPHLLDSNNVVSAPTPNTSSFSINGESDSWVASISDAVMGVIDNRRTKRELIHRAFVYDYGLLIIGFPLGLYVCWKLSNLIEGQLGSIHTFLSAAAYLYVVIFIAWLYRIFFGYTKWAFPTVELSESKDASKRHRRFWYAITVAIVAKFIWEISF